MWAYMLRRVLATLPVLAGVVVLVALMIHLIPGDPVDALLGDMATEQQRAAMRTALGLDRSIAAQVYRFLANALAGDLGESFIYQRPVAELIAERLRPTVELACVAIIIALCLAFTLGTLAALYRAKWIDHLAMLTSLFAAAIPNFWLGPMLVMVFALTLGWLPVSERSDWTSYLLPAFTLGASLAAILSRLVRNALLDTLSQDYVRTAKAKGLPQRRILLRHAFKNAALPIVTVVGLQMGSLLTGAVVTESIFDWPGLGTLVLEALGQRDYPLVQGCVLVFALIYALVNLATDLVYARVDPRVQLHTS